MTTRHDRQARTVWKLASHPGGALRRLPGGRSAARLDGGSQRRRLARGRRHTGRIVQCHGVARGTLVRRPLPTWAGAGASARSLTWPSWQHGQRASARLFTPVLVREPTVHGTVNPTRHGHVERAGRRRIQVVLAHFQEQRPIRSAIDGEPAAPALTSTQETQQRHAAPTSSSCRSRARPRTWPREDG